MNIITTSEARKRFAELVNTVKFSNQPIAIGRHNKVEALLIKFPDTINPLLDEMTNMNAYGGAFDELAEEPDLYTKEDLKTSYV